MTCFLLSRSRTISWKSTRAPDAYYAGLIIILRNVRKGRGSAQEQRSLKERTKREKKERKDKKEENPAIERLHEQHKQALRKVSENKNLIGRLEKESRSLKQKAMSKRVSFPVPALRRRRNAQRIRPAVKIYPAPTGRSKTRSTRSERKH